MRNFEQIEMAILDQIQELEAQLTRIKGDLAFYEASTDTEQKAYFFECVVEGLNGIKPHRISSNALKQALKEIKTQ